MYTNGVHIFSKYIPCQFVYFIGCGVSLCCSCVLLNFQYIPELSRCRINDTCVLYNASVLCRNNFEKTIKSIICASCKVGVILSQIKMSMTTYCRSIVRSIFQICSVLKIKHMDRYMQVPLIDIVLQSVQRTHTQKYQILLK